MPLAPETKFPNEPIFAEFPPQLWSTTALIDSVEGQVSPPARPARRLGGLHALNRPQTLARTRQPARPAESPPWEKNDLDMADGMW